MRTRSLLAASAFVLCTAACNSSSSGLLLQGSGTQCTPAGQGGAVCIKVVGSVDDVFGYLSATNSPLAGKHWRLVLDRYPCDPGSGVQPSCAATGSYPGPTRLGVPPIQSDCRRSDGTTDKTSPGCHNTLAVEVATQGDFNGFDLTQQGDQVAQPTWFCISEQQKSARRWTAPTVPTTPLRACTKVTPTTPTPADTAAPASIPSAAVENDYAHDEKFCARAPLAGSVDYLVRAHRVTLRFHVGGLPSRSQVGVNWINNPVRGYLIASVRTNTNGRADQSTLRMFRGGEVRGRGMQLTNNQLTPIARLNPC